MTQSFNFGDEVAKAEAVLIDVVERKVKAASTAATIVAAVVSLLGLYVFHGDVPDWVSVAVGSLVTGGLTFFAGWWAKHTPRTVTPPPDPGQAPPATGTASAPGSN